MPSWLQWVQFRAQPPRHEGIPSSNLDQMNDVDLAVFCSSFSLIWETGRGGPGLERELSFRSPFVASYHSLPWRFGGLQVAPTARFPPRSWRPSPPSAPSLRLFGGSPQARGAAKNPAPEPSNSHRQAYKALASPTSDSPQGDLV